MNRWMGGGSLRCFSANCINTQDEPGKKEGGVGGLRREERM